MTLHIFNPEHDIALAANSPFWTSPKAGSMLRRNLGWLPVLWAKPGDVIVVDSISEAYQDVLRLEGILGEVFPEVRFCTLGDLRKKNSMKVVGRIDTWGWDVSIVNQLVRAGVPRGLMPREALLIRQRSLSDRALSSRLLRHLVHSFSGVCGESVVIYNINNVEVVAEEWGDIILKSPWSSSGRGVRLWDGRHPGVHRWAEKVIEAQGHIMVERYFDKVVDFAMEFYACEDGRVCYDGLSLFDTTGGAYVGNVIALEEEKVKILSSYVHPQLLRDIAEHICRWMESAISGCYVGPFGVDMMIVRPYGGDGFLVDPCVEINLRRTMGHVALCLSQKEAVRGNAMKVVFEGGRYHFCIEPDVSGL